MYNLIEYNSSYLKTSGSLWQYYIDKPDLYDNGNTVDFTFNNASDLYKLREKITGQTRNNGTKNFGIIVQLIYLSNF